MVKGCYINNHSCIKCEGTGGHINCVAVREYMVKGCYISITTVVWSIRGDWNFTVHIFRWSIKCFRQDFAL